MAVQNNAALPEGLELSGYRIVKKIAVGGFSIVYLAQSDSGQIVAIKEYLPAALAHRSAGQFHPTIAPRNLDLYRVGLKYFFDEGRALADIVHPNIVRVLNFFRAHDTVYMVMTYEDGRSLQEHISLGRQKGGKPLMTEATLSTIFARVMDALREVHTHKLLHLDLKPANIYLRTDGSPILLDFGAARQILHTDLARLHPMYTPGFAAPELASKTGLGPWTDIYSIGATLFACMLGVPPQPASERLIEDRMQTWYEQLAGIYSPGLIALMRQSLMLDPSKRPQSVFSLQKALRETTQANAHAQDGILSRLRSLVG